MQTFNIPIVPDDKKSKGSAYTAQPFLQPKKPTLKNTTDKHGEVDQYRRNIIKLMGAGAALVGLASVGVIKFENSTEDTPKDDNEREAIKDAYLEDKRQEQIKNAREYIETIEFDDVEVIGKTFQEQIRAHAHVTLDQATRNAIHHSWREKYAPGTVNYRDGIIAGLERMRPWAAEIKKIFKQYDVPEEYIYLSIAESHFSSKKISTAGAVGPHQITAKTARLERFKLIIDNAYDERLDPLKSAELCAKHLRYSYKEFGCNWDLALLDYNGGYTKDFMEYVKKSEEALSPEEISSHGTHIIKDGETLSDIAPRFKTSLTLLYIKNSLNKDTARQIRKNDVIVIPQERDVSMGSFNAWLEKTINATIQAELKSDSYAVRQGDTLEKIAKKFGMDIANLKSNNPDVHNRLLRVGQKIHIPLAYKKSPEFLLEVLSGFSENINYPGKFHAIVEIIKENKLDSVLNNQQRSFLEVPLKNSSTLKDISKAYTMDIHKLLELNPAIKHPGARLLRGLEIRIPNQYLIAKSESTRKN